jgi:hypothetical protein
MKLTAEQKKYAIYGGIGLTAFLLWYFLKPKNGSGGGQGDPTNNNDSSGGQISTFDPKNVAENLYEAMKSLGTDESAIFNSLANVNQTQFAQVIKEFGNRVYNTYTGGTAFGSPYPLKVWLKEELSDDEYKTLRLKYPNYL